ncbi:MAG: hypothetical protein DRQ45_02260 [Gammaproteobacteria bacterium]|nr:MAG: hypothetical protein DRQ45_02260 [Gammaproteobacteria bacterium]
MRMIQVLLLMASAAVQAEVYKSINADGEVIYSDQPGRGAERVQMPALPTYTPQPVRTLSRSTRPAVQQINYEHFTLSSPANEATVRNNLGTVQITTVLTPALMSSLGHSIQYYLDGVAHGAAIDRTTLTLANVDRGQHQLSASVLDASGNVLISTSETTVFIKRNSKLHGDRQGSVTANPGYMTENPNIVGDETFEPYKLKDIADFSGKATDIDPDIAELPANPGYRNRNPNILSPNPNIISPNPNLINPPRPPSD